MKKWWKDLNMTGKLLLVILVVSLIPLVTFAGMAFDDVFSSMEEAEIRKLEAVRNIKRDQVRGAIDNVINQIMAFSESRMIVQGMRQLKEGWELAAEEYEVDEHRKESYSRSIKGYYKSEFLPLLKKNPGEEMSAEMRCPRRDNSVALQAKYMVLNSNSPTEKERLDGAYDETTYTTAHEQYHPFFRSYKIQFGYDDIMLVDPETGVIIYSVYKKVDYCTSLLDGPYKNTNLGKAFKLAAESEKREAVIVDFEAYAPSLGKQAAFISVPVLDRRDNKIGILIFQMPVDRINEIMTSNGRWKEYGLGDSGDCYLVGRDRTIRTDLREVVEERERLRKETNKKDTPLDILKKIPENKRKIGYFMADGEGVEKAVAGETGVICTRNYKGDEVFAAYTKLDISGLRWGLIVEQSKSEAVSSSYSLLLRMGGLIILFSGLIVWGARYVAQTISKPLVKMKGTLGKAVENADLTVRLPALYRDEVGDVGRSINAFMERMQELMKEVHRNSSEVGISSNKLSETSENLASSARSQKEKTGEIVKSVKELYSTSREISVAVEKTRKASVEASELTVSGGQTIQKSIDALRGIATQTEELSGNIDNLSDSAGKIGKIVDVIDGVADQTNLLALNAAIEAAGAGYAGRGFAVVAEEVRKLAVRTAASTREISVIIKQLQNEAWSTNRAMKKASVEVRKGSESGQESLKLLQQIIERGANIQDAMGEIATSITQENVAIEIISSNGDQILEAVNRSGNSVVEVAGTAEQFVKDAEDLRKRVGMFTI